MENNERTRCCTTREKPLGMPAKASFSSCLAFAVYTTIQQFNSFTPATHATCQVSEIGAGHRFCQRFPAEYVGKYLAASETSVP